jgi:hypothetical protein
MGLASQFDRTVGKDPKSEAGKRKAHRLKLGHRSIHAVLSLSDSVRTVAPVVGAKAPWIVAVNCSLLTGLIPAITP